MVFPRAALRSTRPRGPQGFSRGLRFAPPARGALKGFPAGCAQATTVVTVDSGGQTSSHRGVEAAGATRGSTPIPVGNLRGTGCDEVVTDRPRPDTGTPLAEGASRMSRHLHLLLSLGFAFGAASTTACLDDADKGAEDDALGDIDVAKDDSFAQPITHGTVGYGVPANSALTRTARFHAWEFDVLLPGSTPTALLVGPQAENDPAVDTVLYLYKQQANGRWGSYIARNDDAGGEVWSALSKTLTNGRYRIIVKGYTATTYGKFSVLLSCKRPGCTPPEPTCAFGDTFAGLDRQRFAYGPSQALTSAVGLDDLTRAQIVRALQASSHTDVTTAEQAFQRADGGVINRLELRDWFAVRRYFAYEYGAGDNSYGAIFDERDLEPAAEIHDGDIAACQVPLATCIFGGHYDLAAEPDLSVTAELTITAATTTTAQVRAQILAAAQLYLPTVTTMADLFGRVTDNEVRRVDVTHAPSGRQYSFFTFILGDHRFGAAFVKNTTTMAVEIEDDVYARCAAF